MKKYIIILMILIVSALAIPVFASNTLTATTSDTFYFYSLDGLASKDGYDAAIVVDGTPYYLDYKCYDKLCEESTSFAKGFISQYQDTSTKQDIYNRINIKVGEIRTEGSSNGEFELPIDKEIKFEYQTGTVGLNKEAKIITKIIEVN